MIGVDTVFRQQFSRAAEELGFQPGAGLQFLNSYASGAAATELDVPLPGTFKRYVLKVRVLETTDTDLQLLLSNDGGATFPEGAADYTQVLASMGTAISVVANTGVPNLLPIDTLSMGGTNDVAGETEITIENVGALGTYQPNLSWKTIGRDNANVRAKMQWGAGRRLASVKIDALRFRPTPPLVFTCEVDLFGLGAL